MFFSSSSQCCTRLFRWPLVFSMSWISKDENSLVQLQLYEKRFPIQKTLAFSKKINLQSRTPCKPKRKRLTSAPNQRNLWSANGLFSIAVTRTLWGGSRKHLQKRQSKSLCTEVPLAKQQRTAINSWWYRCGHISSLPSKGHWENCLSTQNGAHSLEPWEAELRILCHCPLGKLSHLLESPNQMKGSLTCFIPSLYLLDSLRHKQPASGGKLHVALVATAAKRFVLPREPHYWQLASYDDPAAVVSKRFEGSTKGKYSKGSETGLSVQQT